MAILLLLPIGCSSGESAYRKLRERMVQDQILGRGVTDSLVLDAMSRVPRHRFVPPGYRSSAYIDSPLPIGSRQTISQPYIVALMTASMNLSGGERVMEVGTGSGYQAAVLACIADSVFSIEIIPELASRASAVLDSLGYGNVRVVQGDGYYGLPGKAPFDAIIVTAAAPEVPEKLVRQLKSGGRLVLPVGDFLQHLKVYRKTGDGLELLDSQSVRFVPMTGKIRE
ncbi:MAG: protein-L-isoaspartate(D-aspartate) O-methyltransferase [Candidatus Latescibacteria bacterium]|nr:protein-L-isoaspartate(D-aspartate) O-methyltransferase [bacterium]MBD3424540.1 protein-L-isoaspartate(D-aspartate) O-methyltransferase [Candidatus Latescibacterota bacterium]